jgi:hypothetical protein
LVWKVRERLILGARETADLKEKAHDGTGGTGAEFVRITVAKAKNSV